MAWLALASLPIGASADQSVKLSAKLTPERLGYGTTVNFDFAIAGAGGGIPAPLTGVELNYPAKLGFALSGLGLDKCAQEALEALGVSGCPANSRMGVGTALAAIPVGPFAVREPAQVTIVRAATGAGDLAMLFYVNGEAPVIAQLVLPGLLLPANPPFGGRIGIEVPLVAGLPEGPDVSVVRLRATIGPQHLTYYEHVGGKIVSYTPQGIVLPKICPRGGFRFSGVFRFLDGTEARARDAVPCPARSLAARHGCRSWASARRTRQGEACTGARRRVS